jgi:hypothetical protein
MSLLWTAMMKLVATTTSLELDKKSIVKDAERNSNPTLQLTSRSIIEPKNISVYSSRHESIDHFNISAVLLGKFFHQGLRASSSVVRRSCFHWRTNAFPYTTPHTWHMIGPMMKPHRAMVTNCACVA